MASGRAERQKVPFGSGDGSEVNPMCRRTPPEAKTAQVVDRPLTHEDSYSRKGGMRQEKQHASSRRMLLVESKSEFDETPIVCKIIPSIWLLQEKR